MNTKSMAKNFNFAPTSNVSKSLAQKFLFVLLVLVIYRLGTFIPIPGIDPIAMQSLENSKGAGVLGLLNAFTGGALGRMSIFALNIIPFITASIIMQLLTYMVPYLEQIKKQGEQGSKTIVQYTRYFTIILALVQGYGIAAGLEKLNGAGYAVIPNPGLSFKIMAAACIACGTMTVMWFSEQITNQGIGNGSSIIIFTGIISGMPRAIAALFDLGRTGALNSFVILAIIIVAVLLITGIVFVERAQRKISVQYPRKQVGRQMMGGGSTHLPLKLNTAGVIPPIFAGSLLSFPSTIIGFQSSFDPDSILGFIARNLVSGKPIYILIYTVLITFFCFFYTSIIFNSKETAENLRKSGAVVLGRRPGDHTANYFDKVLSRLTVFGALYLAVVCVIPEIFVSKLSIPFYLGGTSLLIVVNVITDMFNQIQSHMLNSQYAKLLDMTNRKR